MEKSLLAIIHSLLGGIVHGRGQVAIVMLYRIDDETNELERLTSPLIAADHMHIQRGKFFAVDL
jgi:hypothetical protein